MAAGPGCAPRRPIPLSRFPLVHAVTDDRVLALPDFLARAAAIATVPDCAIHLRGRLPGDRLLALADHLRALTAGSSTRLLIHDRLDVAVLSGADGLHLPAAGFPATAARAALGPDRLLGRSIHDPAEAASAGTDYVLLGNIWPTASHPGRSGLGPAAITAAQPARTVAIGGVTPATAPAAIAAGAAGVAAIRALWDAQDPGAAAHAFRVLFAQ